MKRLPTTPRSHVRHALRQLTLRSRERQAVLKRDKYTCVDCSVKQSRAKGRKVYVEVDHLNGIQLERVIDYIFKHLLVSPNEMETVCKACHLVRTALRKELGAE